MYVKQGEVALEVYGSARSILTTERLVLNCIQRMSGIATTARDMAKQIVGTKAKILDTRKTTLILGCAKSGRFTLAVCKITVMDCTT